MTNNYIADLIFTGAWRDRMVTKKQGCHSIAPANKQVYDEMLYPTSSEQ